MPQGEGEASGQAQAQHGGADAEKSTGAGDVGHDLPYVRGRDRLGEAALLKRRGWRRVRRCGDEWERYYDGRRTGTLPWYRNPEFS